jgi:beta-lactamase superfamily II metal-dependent hydrolase
MSAERISVPEADVASVATVHLLDVGPQQYGDALLCLFKNETILIDGAHPGNYKALEGHPPIQEQLGEILSQPADHLRVSLLMISHAHDDHIGCLPRLVKNGWLAAEWAIVPDPDLGFGRSQTDARPDAALDFRSRQVVAALREEPRSAGLSDAQLAEFLSDAVDLESEYGEMIDTLKANGTKVVRFGRDSATTLLQRFAGVGLELLGPSKEHVVVCAENILRKRLDAMNLVRSTVSGDAVSSPVDVYRRLVAGNIDAADLARAGNFVNLQSIVACFAVGGKRFFFAGDMQFVDPQTTNETITAELESLKTKIAARAPFAFFKLCHHGSNNGFDEAILGDIGETRYLGICAGTKSERHPHPETLGLLKKNTERLEWARTDHNGHCTFDYKAKKTIVTPEKGVLNDAVPNKKLDEVVSASPTALVLPRALPVAPAERRLETIVDNRVVEVITRVPHARTRVTITIDVAPEADAARDVRAAGAISQDLTGFSLTPAVRDLLFVTKGRRLAANIGNDVASTVIDALRDSGATLIDIPEGATDAASASAPVRKEIRSRGNIKGVVLLGGYDVVPSQVLDALPPSLRATVGSTGDPDNFIVWNDETYGDVDGDFLPELPVSRIPDGRSADLVLNALSQTKNGGSAAVGVRNVMRPFADAVFGRINGSGGLLQSAPTGSASPGVTLDGQHVYLMLHGDYSDGGRYWGEDPPDNIEAINVANVPGSTRAVVFTGCCWGALTVDRPAGRAGTQLAPKLPEASIALSFLKSGARAFVGCTGAHYSPDQAPYDYFGGPMHHAFWRRLLAGAAPAAALFDAKREYVRAIPHGQTKPSSTAIEFKIWRQYTCLGLGW